MNENNTQHMPLQWTGNVSSQSDTDHSGEW